LSSVDSVSVGNREPRVGAKTLDQSASAGQQWVFVLPENVFTDEDGDTISITTTGTPSWLLFVPSTRTFSGTPQNEGTSAITLFGRDGFGGVAIDSFTVTSLKIFHFLQNSFLCSYCTDTASCEWSLCITF
jgi:hypothetical protein